MMLAAAPNPLPWLVYVAEKRRSRPALIWLCGMLALLGNVPLRKPLLDKEAAGARFGRATLPLGAFCLKNSLEAALELLAWRW